MYEAVDEGNGIKEDLDSGQTNMMETGGNSHTTVQSVLPENDIAWSFLILYFRSLDA